MIVKILTVVVLLLGSLSGGVSNSAGLGNAGSISNKCDAFEGVFQANGRVTPKFEIGAPLPNKVPGSVWSTNDVAISQFLGCHPECMSGLNYRFTSFAIQYNSGALRWAALHSPSGDAVYHGKTAMSCDSGELVYSNKARVLSASGSQNALDNNEDLGFAVINDEGWLVGYKKHNVNGETSILYPVKGSRSEGWLEFPPDARIQISLKMLFDGLSNPGELKVVAVGDPDANAYQKRAQQLAPHRVLLVNDGSNTTEETIGETSLLLLSVNQEKREDGFYNISADIRACKGGEEQIIRLERDYSGLDFQYLPVFDQEMALEVIYQQFASITILRPERARLLVRKK